MVDLQGGPGPLEVPYCSPFLPKCVPPTMPTLRPTSRTQPEKAMYCGVHLGGSHGGVPLEPLVKLISIWWVGTKIYSSFGLRQAS